MKVTILGVGSGTRLYPLTMVTSKQLLPVYDKPMIYYSLSTLMLAGVKDILIISTPTDTSRFEGLLGDGSQFGVNLSYKVQTSSDGLAQAFILGEEFLNEEAGAMVLGDNIFYGNGFSKILKAAVEDAELNGRTTVFGYYVPDSERFGVVSFDENRQVTSIEEKTDDLKAIMLSLVCISIWQEYQLKLTVGKKQCKRLANSQTGCFFLYPFIIYIYNTTLFIKIKIKNYAVCDVIFLNLLVILICSFLSF